MPERIQRKRTKGWRMPEGAVYVGRPTMWGNPLPPNQWGLERSLAVYSDLVRGIWDPTHLADCDSATYGIAYGNCHAWRQRIGYHPTEAIRYELRGLDLACWCSLDSPCHADVLLEVANA